MAAESYPLMNAPEIPQSSPDEKEVKRIPICQMCEHPTVLVWSRRAQGMVSHCCLADTWRDADYQRLGKVEQLKERCERVLAGDYDLPLLSSIEAALDALKEGK